MAIIPNGKITFIVPPTVDPVTGKEEARSGKSRTVDCQIVPVSYNALAMSDNERISAASYKVYVDESSCTPTQRCRVECREMASFNDREYPVIWIERLRAVCQYRVWI